MSLIKLAERWEHLCGPGNIGRSLRDCIADLRSALSDLAQADPEGLVRQYYDTVARVEGWPAYWDPKDLDRARKRIDDAKQAILVRLSLLSEQRDHWQSTAELHAQETLAAQAALRVAEEQRDAAVALIEAQEELTKAGWCRYLEDGKTLAGPEPVRLSRATEAETAARLRYEQAMAGEKEEA